MFNFIHRKLTKNEADLLVENIKLTPNIVGYSEEEWLEFNSDNLIVAENEKGEMVGVCYYYDFAKGDFSYLAVLYVLDEYRGHGIGKKLFYQGCSTILNYKKNLYTSTRNPAVIKMMKDLGFVIFDTLFTLPEPFKEFEREFLLRGAKWIANSYRVKEIARKAIAFPNQPSFVYGIKSYD